MIDPKLLRDSPDLVRAAIAKKHLAVDLDAVLALDTAWRAAVQEVESLRGKQKAANTAMAALPKGSPEFQTKVAEMKAVSAQVKEKEAALKETEERCKQAMHTLPNLPHASVPEGRDATENVVFSSHGDTAAVSPAAMPGRYFFFAAASPELINVCAASTTVEKYGAHNSARPISSSTMPSSTNE